MKKYLIILLALIMTLSFAACGNGSGSNEDPDTYEEGGTGTYDDYDDYDDYGGTEEDGVFEDFSIKLFDYSYSDFIDGSISGSDFVQYSYYFHDPEGVEFIEVIYSNEPVSDDMIQEFIDEGATEATYGGFHGYEKPDGEMWSVFLFNTENNSWAIHVSNRDDYEKVVNSIKAR
jgi:hypothetical protein